MAEGHYSRILVALDGSKLAEQILPHVEPLAEKFGSTLILLRATTSAEMAVVAVGAPAAGVMPIDPAPIVEADRQGAATYLRTIAERLRGRGLAVEQEHPEGPAARVIVERARHHNVDLIAMTTHGRGGLGRIFFGSVADEVLRTASQAILLVRVGDAS